MQVTSRDVSLGLAVEQRTVFSHKSILFSCELDTDVISLSKYGWRGSSEMYLRLFL